MSVVEVARDEFWDTVADGLVLVDVWAPSCQSCLALTPQLEELMEQRPELTLAKLDASQARRLCMELKVMGLPTLLLFRDGEELARVSDPKLDRAKVDAWLDEHLG